MADEEKKKKDDWSVDSLPEDKRKEFRFVKDRIIQLQNARKKEQYGIEIEGLWRSADKEYAPHRLGVKNGTRALVEDEEKGWRGTSNVVTLGQDAWQSDLSQPNPYVKIQTALSILVDQNPSGVFSAASKKYQATTELIRQLYQRSWEVAKSKQQLKLFVFNLSKYGWAIARTYPLRIERNVKRLVNYEPESPDDSTYEDVKVCEFDDVFRENIDPWNAWIDDMAKPNNPWSIRDWAWRKVYSLESAKEEFGAWKNFKYVKAGGVVTERIEESQNASKTYEENDLVEVYFYENVQKDIFQVHINGVPVIISPLPISDARGNKKLSLWQAYWNLRHANCPYGIGIWEAIRNEQGLLDRINNMSVDQLVLSIYKMFFYQGTNALTETGEIKIKPGVGKQTLDPKNVTFLEVPGPGAEAITWRELVRKDLDEASGITDPLLGVVTGKTAFEIAQAKESALKRLKTPLENITDALDQEAYVSVALFDLVYSVPEVYQISDPQLIDAYLKETGGDQDLFSRGDEGSFEAKVYREFPMDLNEDEKGNLIETDDTRFFRIKPKYLRWEGVIQVEAQSVLTPSKQVDKALDLEMYNILIPILVQPPQIYSKLAQSICKLYDKDPKDILPDMWLQDQSVLDVAAANQMQEEEPLVVDGAQPPPEAPTAAPSVSGPQNPESLAGQISAKASAPFRV